MNCNTTTSISRPIGCRHGRMEERKAGPTVPLVASMFIIALTLVGGASSLPFIAFSVPSSVDCRRHARSRSTALRLHEFWGKQRSGGEIKSFVEKCLQRDVQYQSSGNAETAEMEPTVQVVSAEPPLVVVHNFLTVPMCQGIMDSAASSENWKRSTTGEANKKSDMRTSSTVWLGDSDCQQPLRLIADKVSSISGLPPSHMENLQVCRYLPGQEFKLHTDHLDSFNDLDCGGRLATCLVYLSEPEAGGATWFPGLATADTGHQKRPQEPQIAPTQGSAVFFWNTIEKPGSPGYHPTMFLNVDMQLRHAGLPVVKGEKWICNRWIHPVSLDLGVRGARPLAGTV